MGFFKDGSTILKILLGLFIILYISQIENSLARIAVATIVGVGAIIMFSLNARHERD